MGTGVTGVLRRDIPGTMGVVTGTKRTRSIRPGSPVTSSSRTDTSTTGRTRPQPTSRRVDRARRRNGTTQSIHRKFSKVENDRL